MTYYVIFDTNVLVSAFLKDHSVPWEMLLMALNGTVIPVVNFEIIEEYHEVLHRDKFGLDKTAVEQLLSYIEGHAIYLERTETDEIFADLDDIVFYEITLTARKSEEAYLVTGNKKHYPVKTFIVSPKEMLDIIRGTEK